MLFFVFFILAGYLSVKCDDASNNYYVIEMPVDVTTVRLMQKPFDVYWNVPTMQCRSKRIPFVDLYEKYGIIQNDGDSFRGEKVTILYDPGLFPALLKNETSGKFKFRNGGVPQEGNLTSHLDAFRATVEKSIPNENFEGVGIIDFESWRPIFRQNFGVLLPYKDVSVQIEKKLHWWWPNTWLQQEAKDRFEEAAREFMQSTISVAKQMRPLAQWGYYGFPYCFNVATNNPGEACPTNVIRENNQIKWLWSESTSLYPSVYSSKNLTTKQLTSLVRGRVSEASRVRRKDTPILPYFWFRYRDGGFLTKEDLETVLKTLYKSEASGFIIWGSSNDVNTVDKCNQLQEYVNSTLGPAIAKYVKYGLRYEDETTTESSETVTESVTTDTTVNDLYNDTNIDVLNANNITNQATSESTANSQNKTINIKLDNVQIQIDPDFKFVPSDTYDGNIIQDVEDELNKKSEYNTTLNNDEKVNEDDNKHNDLIEIFMNVMNSKIKTKTNSNTKENSLSSNYYTSVPFLAYFSKPNHTASNISSSNPIPIKDLKEGTKGFQILSDVIFRGFTLDMHTTEATPSISPTVKDNDYNEVNTMLNELNNLVGKNGNYNIENYTYIDFNDISTSYKYSSTTQEVNENDLDSSTLQNDVSGNDFERTTELSSTTSNSLRYSTTELDSNENIFDTNTENTDITNHTPVETVYIERYTESDSTDATTEDSEVSTNNLSTVPHIDSVTNYSPASPTNLIDDFVEVTEGARSPNETEILLLIDNNSTNDPKPDLYDEITEVSVLEDLENKLSINANNEDETEYNYTTFDALSSSTPDKVTSNSAIGSKNINIIYLLCLKVILST